MDNERVKAAYSVLYEWNMRLNSWSYALQKKANKGRCLKKFTPHYLSCYIVDAQKMVLMGVISPNEAISVLHTKTGREQRNLCLKAGF